MKQPSMNEDISRYKDSIYIIRGRRLVPTKKIRSTCDYSHQLLQMHHFVKKTIRKNNPEFYARVECLQKLILMPPEMNYDLEGMGEVLFLKKWGINKYNLIFNRRKWREGYYDDEGR